ncbi:MAG TPA: hypothetical protein VGJ01_19420 [Pseudolabrys sp.]|jgi:hypothetical protein
MRLRPGTAALAILCSFAAAPAFAAVCLEKSMTIDEIVDAINKTPSCERAMNLFKDCALGSGADSQLGDAVEKKCESDFLSGLKPPQKAAYKCELGVCDRKYRNQSGTMYISFTAFCRAEVAQRYSRRVLKARR